MYKNRLLILFLSLVVIMLVSDTTPALAALGKCRTDPIFRLSNGDIITVTLDIGTTESNIRSAHYTLYVPAGVTVKQVVYTDGGIGEETYQVYQTNPVKTYTTDTVVTTLDSAGIVDVTAYTRLNGVDTKSAFGYNGQHLIVTISKPQWPNVGPLHVQMYMQTP